MSSEHVWRGAGGRHVRVGLYHRIFYACRGNGENELFHWRKDFCDSGFKTRREALFAAMEYATSQSETEQLRALASAYVEIG